MKSKNVEQMVVVQQTANGQTGPTGQNALKDVMVVFKKEHEQ